MSHRPIQQLFQQTAARLPGQPAVETGGEIVTYGELSRRAAALAAALAAAGAGAEPVAILSSRTVDVIAAMLAVLEVGGAFVPLDPSFPLATLPQVVSEVRPRCWLTDPERVELLQRLAAEHDLAAAVIPLSLAREAAAAAPPHRLESDPDRLCYVYFTSGSTGRPKGIGGRLRAVDHFVRWEIEAFGLGDGTRVSQLTSPAFDAFLRDAFVPLVAGGTVCVPPERDIVLDGARLAEWIDRQRLALVHCTPSVFRSLLAQELEPRRFAALRHVLLAGEPLLPGDVRSWHRVFGGRIQLVNLYGPSETTMVKLFYPVQPADGEARRIPIGKPMPGASAVVVSEEGRLCPPGRHGEIYIRTPYRSLGYVNRPELTREVFIQNPWSDSPDDIVYKTGDLGRVREDGNFEILGRRDQQVKVRGLRIELAPIEDRLRSHPDVAEAVVADRTDGQGNKFLCAYVVARREVAPGALADHLRAALPEPFIPSSFVVLDALPRSLSGKIDRGALPSPGEAAGGARRPYVAPRTPVEETLCRHFSELLSVPRVGIHDSFFELGGHSLLVGQLLARMHASLAPLSMGQVFQTPTVEALALAVTAARLERQGVEAAAMIGEVEGLSEESLEEMLRREGMA